MKPKYLPNPLRPSNLIFTPHTAEQKHGVEKSIHPSTARNRVVASASLLRRSQPVSPLVTATSSAILVPHRVTMALAHQGRNVLRHIIKENTVHSCDQMIQPLLYACQGVRYRKLEVILTTSIEKLGKAGQTVKVAPGYFRNHLMPKLLAVPNIDKFKHLIQEQREIHQPQEVEEVKVVTQTVEDKTKEYEKAAKRLDNSRLVLRRLINIEKFSARATKDDPIELRMPVTKDELVSEVARQLNVQIEPENLHLPTPLSTFGEFEVPLRLPKSIPLPEGKVQWTMKVKIRGK